MINIAKQSLALSFEKDFTCGSCMVTLGIFCAPGSYSYKRCVPIDSSRFSCESSYSIRASVELTLVGLQEFYG